MLDGDAAPLLALDTLCHCRSHFSGHQRILGIILKVSPAQRISLNIHSRSQPQIHMKFLHFYGYCPAEFSEQFSVPGLRQSCANRKGRAILIISICIFMLLFFFKEAIFQTCQHSCPIDRVIFSIDLIMLTKSQSCRSVRHDQGSDTVFFLQRLRCFSRRSRNTHTGRAECTGSLCNISIQKRKKIFCRNILQRLHGICPFFLFFRNKGDLLHRFSQRTVHPPEEAVSFRDLHLGNTHWPAIRCLLQNGRFIHAYESCRLHTARMAAHTDAISPCFYDPCLLFFRKYSQIFLFCKNCDLTGFSGSDLWCFFKPDQSLEFLFFPCLGHGGIYLDNLASGKGISRICDFNLDL